MGDTIGANVDSYTTDKYLEDLKKGTPKFNTVLGLEITEKGLEIRMDEQELKAAKAVISVDRIKEFGEVTTPVRTVSLDKLNELKAVMKARQAKQEATIKQVKTERDSEIEK